MLFNLLINVSSTKNPQQVNAHHSLRTPAGAVNAAPEFENNLYYPPHQTAQRSGVDCGVTFPHTSPPGSMRRTVKAIRRIINGYQFCNIQPLLSLEPFCRKSASFSGSSLEVQQ